MYKKLIGRQTVYNSYTIYDLIPYHNKFFSVSATSVAKHSFSYDCCPGQRVGPSLTLAIIVHINIIDNDDNCTVRHHLSNLNGTYEHYCEQYINHRHRVDCYINCVPVFSFFIIILLVPYDISYRYPALTISPKVETGKTWSIFNVLN